MGGIERGLRCRVSGFRKEDGTSRVLKSSTVVVAVVVGRKDRKTGEKAEMLLTPHTKEN